MGCESTVRRRVHAVLAVLASVTGGLALETAAAADAGDAPAVDPVVDAGVPDVLTAPAAGSALVGCDRADERLVLTASAHLDPACTYTRGITIRGSDVTLDCQGAQIKRLGGGRGIEVSSPSDVSMSGVVVRNCRVDGFLNSLRVTRDGFRTLAAGEEFDHVLDGTVIEHSEFTGSRGVGIFADGYVSGVTIRRSVIRGAGSAGIYLETGSRGHLVENNVIHDNGFRENGPHGQLVELGGTRFRFWGPGREGVAIDGSYENTIRGNSFEGNSHGGVFLYKNCGEFPDSGVWFERRTGADDNLIEDNTFTGGVFGVWVGQRMGENTFPMECTDEAYFTGAVQRVVLDFARRNTVRANRFVDVTYGVRVEDDGTRVEGNHFSAPSDDHHAVVVGTRVRTAELDRPVADTTLVDNVSEIVGNPNPFRWVHGFERLRVLGNRALGTPVGICEGDELPHLLFIWVLALAIEPPGSPVTPTPPDLAMPTLGALAPCDTLAVPRVVPGVARVDEGSTATLPVTLSNESDRSVLVEWRTLDVAVGAPWAAGGDFVSRRGSIEVDPGQTTTAIEIPTLDDSHAEDTEYVVVQFHSPVNADIGGLWGLGFVAIADRSTLTG